MFPLFQVGNLIFHTYGLLLCLAILSAMFLSVSSAKRLDYETSSLWKVLGLTAFAGVVFCRVGDSLLHPSLYTRSPELLLVNGGTFLFGFLAGISVAVGLCMKHGMSFWALSDCCAPYLALGIGIGRAGCFAAGCDYGKPSSLPWSVTFTNPAAASLSGVPLNISLHPSQLYESIYEFLLFVVLMFVSRKHPPTRTLTWLFVLFYSIGRFLIEFTRGDPDRGFWGPLSISQWLCGVLLVTVLILSRLIPDAQGATRSNKDSTIDLVPGLPTEHTVTR